MESVFNWLYELMYQNDGLALFSSFGWGMLSVLLSPCHLASLPLLIAYIANRNNDGGSSPFQLSLLFSLGILATILIIGVITSSIGRLLGDIGNWSNIIAGLVLIAAGLVLVEVLNINGLKINTSSIVLKGGAFVFILGLSAGLALGPCTFAFMAPVFAYGFQISQSKPIFAALLFLFYGIGHCLVIVAAGTLSAKIQQFLNWVGASTGVLIFKKTCGVLALAGGAYIIYLGLF